MENWLNPKESDDNASEDSSNSNTTSNSNTKDSSAKPEKVVENVGDAFEDLFGEG